MRFPRRLLSLLVLLPVLAAPGPGPGGHGLGGNPGNGNDGNVVFRFLPAGGSGAPAILDLCDNMASSDLVGNWLCMKGDGTVRSGSLALTATGSPTTQTLGVCPNGVNCTPVATQRFNGTSQYYTSGAIASPTGDFSACVVMRRDDAASTYQLLTKDNSGGGLRGFEFRADANGAVAFVLYKTGDATATGVTTGAAVITGAQHLLCVTYDFITNGTSVGTVYVDGVQTGSINSTMGGPMQVNTTAWNVGRRQYGGAESYLVGTIRNALVTETVLSAATITAMANSVLGLPISGTRGETLTFTRTSAKSCVANDGTVNTLPGGRPCLTNGGYVPEQNYTNLALRSDAFDNASWLKLSAVVAAPVVTADSTDVAAPDGSNNADKVVFPAVANANDVSMVYQNITTTAAAHAFGLWLRTLSGTATVYLIQNTSGPGYVGTTTCSVTTTWTRCKAESVIMGAGATTVAFGTDLRASSGCSATAASTIYAWGYQAQLANQGFLSSYIATAGTGVATTGDALAWTTGFVDPGPTPSFAVDIIPYALSGNYYAAALHGSTTADDWEFYNTVGTSTALYATVGSVLKGPATSGAPTAGVSYHYSSSYDGTTMRVCKDHAGCGTASSTFTPAAMLSLSIGTWNNSTTAYPSNANISNVCVGKTPTACYP